MSTGLLILWLISGMLLMFEDKVYRLIVYFCIFSLISSVSYLLMGAPDVAMAEAAISAFAVIFFIICVEKYYSRKVMREEEDEKDEGVKEWAIKYFPAIALCVGLFGLFVYFAPDGTVSTYLKELYITRFMPEVGGKNAVTAIYLGYRVYDTLFEALILVIAVVAVSHFSYSEDAQVADGSHSEIEKSGMAIYIMRIICPVIIVFGIYLILNGHISAGGGFQGGLAVATFFICRYFIFDIYDIPVRRVVIFEEIVFVGIIIITVFAVFFVAAAYIPEDFIWIYQYTYLISMNALIGLKVASGFFVLFYRYIAIERR
ncbi:MAG: DUF4040 domain-containing protein [Defluviitaleaceae bacterium]|nr:DUF4040 domain-containing protein [Defluviitaleaceae bacterium]